MAIISLMGNNIYDPILDCQSSFEPFEYLYFTTTIIYRQNNFLIVHSEMTIVAINIRRLQLVCYYLSYYGPDSDNS